MPAFASGTPSRGQPGGAYRLMTGGHIDRALPVWFRWNGRRLMGFEGDTLASALLAHGERIVGRSFKFHRPRGILSAGAEEPNALVALGAGNRLEPTARATLVPLREGLQARPQNCWPSVHFDIGRVLDAFAPLLPAGFYNKTFLWPSWQFYEPVIRRTAGIGDALSDPDPDRYESVNASCDLLIVGGGAAGLQAARVAAQTGLRIVIVEQAHAWGGSLLSHDCAIGGLAGHAWSARVVAGLASHPNVTMLPGTTAFGLYDHQVAGLLERVEEHAQQTAKVRHRYWRVRAGGIVLATGAIEQPWVFERNDVPGIMLASAIREYAHRYGVAAGRRIVFATNNDSAYLSALSLARTGTAVPLIVDSREEAPAALAAALCDAGVVVEARAVVSSAHGGRALEGVSVRGIDGNAYAADIECDALGVSGGWMPSVHLFSHSRGQLAFDGQRQCFLPVSGTAPAAVCGALAGASSLAQALESATQAVTAEITRLGLGVPHSSPVEDVRELAARPDTGRTRRSGFGREHRQWIDFQYDVTVADVSLALREGFEAIEHLKRYTTTGMAVDQGKTSNLNALLLVAELTGQPPQLVGTTTFRPPYMPVTLGALAGRQIGEHYAPRRLLPAHAEHESLQAHFEEAGGWMRPACYPRTGESNADAIRREALAVRKSVGLFDASPLGKIEIEGADAARFLDRFYINDLLTLEPGRTRYALMLNENGAIIDDGTVSRLAAEHFVITTTSSGAERIAQWLEEWHQCEWPDMDVLITPVTTQWATVALAGPKARDVLSRLPTDIDLDAKVFPHMHVRTGTLGGVPARVYRVSFSGELGFEINVPSRYGAALWRALLDLGRDAGITPYGIDALMLLRLEKGFLHVGLDTDGSTSPADVGWGEIALKKQADYVGKRSLLRADNMRPDRLQLVGLDGSDAEALVTGAHVRFEGTHEGSDGWVTSAALSPTLGRPIALAMVRGGRARLGQQLTVHDLGRITTAKIVKTPFYDPDGGRLRA